jgi:inhibitor of cysteine peptidase
MAEVLLCEIDHGREINLVAGDWLTIRLDENLSTGYGWELAGIDARLGELVSNRHLPGPPVIGGGGTREVTVKAVGVGAGTVCLRLRRAWDPPGVEADRFEISFRIG